MTPENVPAELVELARKRIVGAANIALREMLAAVLPEHEKQVRDQITRDLLEERRKVADAEGATARDEAVITGACNGLIAAIRIVGGKS